MPRNSSAKTKKDRITGLTLNIDGIGRLTSDKIYGPGSALADLFPRVEGAPFVQEVELEFGSKEYVVMTARSNNGAVVRSVLQGSFKYGKGKVTSATINAMANASEGPTYGYGDIVTFGGGISVDNPQSSYAWQSALSSNPGSTVASYDKDNGTVTAGDPSAFNAFGGGRFFYENWRENPFASNLI
jgi:hypothetical protein